MITFKQFLREAAVTAGKKPEYFPVDVEHALALLNAHCKNALWMLANDTPIYRGDVDTTVHNTIKKSGFGVVDTTATARESENTSNWYTVILDNHPDRQNFPKRSRSFIASTNKSRAKDYTGWGPENSSPLVLIPADDAKIGVVNREDMWDTRISLFDQNMDIMHFNRFFELVIGAKNDNWSSIVDFDKKLKAGDKAALDKLRFAFVNTLYVNKNHADAVVAKYSKKFLEEVLKAYSAEKTGHTSKTTATMPKKSNSEVWIGGKVVIIKMSMWQQLRKAYLEQQG